MKHTFIIILSLLCSPLLSFAQQGADLLQQMDSRILQLDSLIFTPHAVNVNRGAIPFSALGIERAEAHDSVYAQAVNATVEAKIAAIKAETGIQLTGQTYYRLDNALSLHDDGDGPEVSRYKAKIQAEVRWYFLQSALFKPQGRANEARLQAKIDLLQHERDRIDLTIYRQKELLRWMSDSLLAGVLHHRVRNLQLLQSANVYLLENENISSDDLLRVLDSKAQAERQLATMSSPFQEAITLADIEAWTIDVDTAALMQHLRSTQIDLRLLQARIDLLEQRSKNESWWASARVAPFVRYSGYFRNELGTSTNVDAGVSFTIPVNNESKRKRAVIRAQQAELAASEADIMVQVSDKIGYLTQEIERMNRAILGEKSRIADLKDYLALRARGYENRRGEYSRLDRIKEYNSYLECLEKLVEYQYRRDCLVADLQAFLSDTSILTFCNVLSIKY
ncbi:MAG: hypothetical protein LIP09_04265 [Bacteroidales bacterium]|nr:hypothetical protein [Bacteroidales bacterium]